LNSVIPESFSGFFDGLLLNTGVFGALLLTVVLFGIVLWKALEAGLSDWLKEKLKQNSRVMLLLALYLIPLVACLATQSFYAAAVMALPAVAVAVLYAMKKSPQRWVGRLALVQLAVLVAAGGAQSLVNQYEKERINKKLKVYVVLPIALPLQAQYGNDVDEILDLSNRFRDEIAMIFGKQAEVKPATYRAAKDLDEWKELETAVARTRASGFEADLVMVNQANVTKAAENYLSLQLRVKVPSPAAGKDVYTDLLVIIQRGWLKNLPHIALRSSLQILDKIRGTPLALKSQDEQTIVRRILERYQDLISLETPPPELLEKVERALQSSPLKREEVQTIVNEYPSDETESARKAGRAKEQAYWQRAGLADSPGAEFSPPPAAAAEEPAASQELPKGGAV
jgi:S1-C subfamily serine protease